jgi:hypothetical protein
MVERGLLVAIARYTDGDAVAWPSLLAISPLETHDRSINQPCETTKARRPIWTERPDGRGARGRSPRFT